MADGHYLIKKEDQIQFPTGRYQISDIIKIYPEMKKYIESVKLLQSETRRLEFSKLQLLRDWMEYINKVEKATPHELILPFVAELYPGKGQRTHFHMIRLAQHFGSMSEEAKNIWYPATSKRPTIPNRILRIIEHGQIITEDWVKLLGNIIKYNNHIKQPPSSIQEIETIASGKIFLKCQLRNVDQYPNSITRLQNAIGLDCDNQIRRSLNNLVTPHKQVDDDIINCTLHQLGQRFTFACMVSSFFIPHWLRTKDEKSHNERQRLRVAGHKPILNNQYSHWVFPINQEKHWTVAIVVKCGQRLWVLYMDSLGGKSDIETSPFDLHQFPQIFRAFGRQERSTEFEQLKDEDLSYMSLQCAPQETNDCGPCMLLNAYLVLQEAGQGKRFHCEWKVFAQSTHFATHKMGRKYSQISPRQWVADELDKPISSMDQLYSNIPIKFVDDFKLEDTILGEGSFGQVRIAVCNDNQRVAIKMLKKSTSQEVFENEKRLLERFTQSKVCPSYIDSCWRQPPGPTYIVMQLIDMDAHALNAMIRAHYNESLPFVAGKCFSDVVRRIAQLHKLGYVHRDVKGSNVGIVITKKMFTTRLLDFGLCASTTNLSPVTKPAKSLYYSVKYDKSIREYSFADDLWAIVFSFLQTIGKLPWKDGENEEIIKNKKCELLVMNNPRKECNIPENIHCIINHLIAMDESQEFDYEFIAQKLLIKLNAGVDLNKIVNILHGKKISQEYDSDSEPDVEIEHISTSDEIIRYCIGQVFMFLEHQLGKDEKINIDHEFDNNLFIICQALNLSEKYEDIKTRSLDYLRRAPLTTDEIINTQRKFLINGLVENKLQKYVDYQKQLAKLMKSIKSKSKTKKDFKSKKIKSLHAQWFELWLQAQCEDEAARSRKESFIQAQCEDEAARSRKQSFNEAAKDMLIHLINKPWAVVFSKNGRIDEDYVQYCFLITHAVFHLSNWSQETITALTNDELVNSIKWMITTMSDAISNAEKIIFNHEIIAEIGISMKILMCSLNDDKNEVIFKQADTLINRYWDIIKTVDINSSKSPFVGNNCGRDALEINAHTNVVIAWFTLVRENEYYHVDKFNNQSSINNEIIDDIKNDSSLEDEIVNDLQQTKLTGRRIGMRVVKNVKPIYEPAQDRINYRKAKPIKSKQAKPFQYRQSGWDPHIETQWLEKQLKNITEPITVLKFYSIDSDMNPSNCTASIHTFNCAHHKDARKEVLRRFHSVIEKPEHDFRLLARRYCNEQQALFANDPISSIFDLVRRYPEQCYILAAVCPANVETGKRLLDHWATSPRRHDQDGSYFISPAWLSNNGESALRRLPYIQLPSPNPLNISEIYSIIKQPEEPHKALKVWTFAPNNENASFMQEIYRCLCDSTSEIPSFNSPAGVDWRLPLQFLIQCGVHFVLVLQGEGQVVMTPAALENEACHSVVIGPGDIFGSYAWNHLNFAHATRTIPKALDMHNEYDEVCKLYEACRSNSMTDDRAPEHHGHDDETEFKCKKIKIEHAVKEVIECEAHSMISPPSYSEDSFVILSNELEKRFGAAGSQRDLKAQLGRIGWCAELLVPESTFALLYHDVITNGLTDKHDGVHQIAQLIIQLDKVKPGDLTYNGIAMQLMSAVLSSNQVKGACQIHFGCVGFIDLGKAVGVHGAIRQAKLPWICPFVMQLSDDTSEDQNKCARALAQIRYQTDGVCTLITDKGDKNRRILADRDVGISFVNNHGTIVENAVNYGAVYLADVHPVENIKSLSCSFISSDLLNGGLLEKHKLKIPGVHNAFGYLYVGMSKDSSFTSTMIDTPVHNETWGLMSVHVSFRSPPQLRDDFFNANYEELKNSLSCFGSISPDQPCPFLGSYKNMLSMIDSKNLQKCLGNHTDAKPETMLLLLENPTNICWRMKVVVSVIAHFLAYTEEDKCSLFSLISNVDIFQVCPSLEVLLDRSKIPISRTLRTPYYSQLLKQHEAKLHTYIRRNDRSVSVTIVSTPAGLSLVAVKDIKANSNIILKAATITFVEKDWDALKDNEKKCIAPYVTVGDSASSGVDKLECLIDHSRFIDGFDKNNPKYNCVQADPVEGITFQSRQNIEKEEKIILDYEWQQHEKTTKLALWKKLVSITA